MNTVSSGHIFTLGWRALVQYDVDGSGDVDKSEVQRMLMLGKAQVDSNAATVGMLLSKLDADGDGEVTFKEFSVWSTFTLRCLD